jgi:uncharacterized protein (TIGR03000 family)
MKHRWYFSVVVALAAVAVVAWSTNQAAAQRGSGQNNWQGQGQGNWQGPGQGNWQGQQQGNWRSGQNYNYGNRYQGYGYDNSGGYNNMGSNEQDPNAVLLNVRVPSNAQVWFDGENTQQRGDLRRFVSPPLDPGKTFTYEIKASWTENGRQVERTRKVHVRAGQRLNVDFMANDGGSDNTGPSTGSSDDTYNRNPNMERDRTNIDRDRTNRTPDQQNEMRRDSGDRDIGNKDKNNTPPNPNDKDTNKPPLS